MLSVKRNLITAKAMALSFRRFIPRCAFSPTAAALMLVCVPQIVTYMAVEKGMENKGRTMMLWLQCETWASAVLAEALLTLFFAWNVSQSVQRAGNEIKHSNTPWSSDTPTFKSINGVQALTIELSVFFIMVGLIMERLFILFSIYSAVQWAENEWIQSIVSNGFFHLLLADLGKSVLMSHLVPQIFRTKMKNVNNFEVDSICSLHLKLPEVN